MQIYNYHPATGEYLGESIAQESPLEPGRFLIPAHAATVAPPAPEEGLARVWTGAEWVQVTDLRGTRYWTADGAEHAQTALGKLPEDASQTPPPPPPEAPVDNISMRQARLALLGAGLSDTVEAAIAALPGDAGKAARIEWEYATEIRRDNPLFAQLTNALGLSAAQLDALFTQAATL
jgi:hypothetical protein